MWKTHSTLTNKTKQKTWVLNKKLEYSAEIQQSSALFCLYPKYSWTMARVIENGMGLNDKAFQIENVSDTYSWK